MTAPPTVRLACLLLIGSPGIWPFAAPFRTMGVAVHESMRQPPLGLPSCPRRRRPRPRGESADPRGSMETTGWSRSVGPALAFVAGCLAAALLVLTWEDYACRYLLPSRHRTSLEVAAAPFAAPTVRGLGFGATERGQLVHWDPATQGLPSYNEVLRRHRAERVPRWTAPLDTAAGGAGAAAVRAAAHELLECLQSLHHLQTLARNRDWDAMQALLRPEAAMPAEEGSAAARWTPPLAARLEEAASLARRAAAARSAPEAAATIGFDWGSCAWRHCGALADAQEALDELEHLLGVLEPPEALFCLDVAERSLRDILASVDWERADPEDRRTWKELPAYERYQAMSEDDRESRLDEDYLKALQELKID